jgi:hypothetical protein
VGGFALWLVWDAEAQVHVVPAYCVVDLVHHVAHFN